ncbi:hypothetical protein PPL_00805 [Heterostelium album PN500]|uniref:NmrA-like domain-containing protein n=1 Tax=Heterostelium pallidum (strain ATCC 26659 / Pp 5 / PN500) TaxID=670386 RepID=D3AXH4_HETP5|nr:hypothetical protein PPL_00805 [Heterostelium album PN500]EFA86243.1 hypothetical protein PPL_00805 [Heterostelium album PN500]|eukprot:XP_020438348.1 hypothetical protein PPL_00805 [Heterostelium album PN500]
MTKPIFVVISAFSKQGYSIINTLVAEGNYHIRATTTRAVDNTPAALKLKERGVEVVRADPTKKEDLHKVFKGAKAAFLLTPNIDLSDPNFNQREAEYVSLQADIALEEKVEHVIFSSVDVPTAEQLKEFKHDILSGKNKAQKYIESLPLKYVSTFNLAYFYSNQIEFFPLIKNSDGSFELSMPLGADVEQPYVDTYTATGPIVSEFLAHPEKYNRAVVPVVSEFLTGRQMAQTFQEVTGIKTTYKELSREQYLEQYSFNGSPEQQLVGNRLFEVWDETSKCGYYNHDRDVTLSKKINPKQLTWRQFLETTKWRGESFQEFRDKNGY